MLKYTFYFNGLSTLGTISQEGYNRTIFTQKLKKHLLKTEKILFLRLKRKPERENTFVITV